MTPTTLRRMRSCVGARQLAIELLAADAISENQLAERLGVNRSTIREWTGK